MVGLGDVELGIGDAGVPQPTAVSANVVAAAKEASESVFVGVIVVIVSCSFRHL